MARALLIGIGAIALAGAGTATYLFAGVPSGPERDLSLAADAEHGAYLIRLGGCVACHTDTANEGAFLAGGAPIESPFGDFIAPNITSDPDAGIGAWTLAEFSRAMSDGIGRNEEHLYPAFPYQNYTLMSDQDIVDLYAALMETGAASAPGHDLSFPFNMRGGMAAWKTLFFTPERFVPNPEKSEFWNRGAYIVNGPAHCGACHSPRNALGAPQGEPLSGGIGPAITTQALLDIGYDQPWLEEVLQGGVTPEFDIPGGDMVEVINEGTIHWTGEDIAAVAAYLMDNAN
jgi:mono/diheme cytochrome c family protein